MWLSVMRIGYEDDSGLESLAHTERVITFPSKVVSERLHWVLMCESAAEYCKRLRLIWSVVLSVPAEH